MTRRGRGRVHCHWRIASNQANTLWEKAPPSRNAEAREYPPRNNWVVRALKSESQDHSVLHRDTCARFQQQANCPVLPVPQPLIHGKRNQGVLHFPANELSVRGGYHQEAARPSAGQCSRAERDREE